MILIGLLAICAIAVTKNYAIKSFDSISGIERVELTGNYSGESFEVETDILKIDIPLNGEIKEDAEINEYTESYQIKTNGYIIIVYSGETFSNEEYSKKESRKYLDTNSYNEYMFALYKRESITPSFFKPYFSIKKEFEYQLDRYLEIPFQEECKYSSFEKNNYAYAVSFNNLMVSDISYDCVNIDIFDMENNYNNLASISIAKLLDDQNTKLMTNEEVLFILESIVIYDN